MEAFIVANPAFVKLAFGALVAIIITFGGVIIRMCSQIFKHMVRQLERLNQNFEQSQKDNGQEIGLLKDRMQKVETTCDMQRSVCPAYNHATQPEGGRGIPWIGRILSRVSPRR